MVQENLKPVEPRMPEKPPESIRVEKELQRAPVSPIKQEQPPLPQKTVTASPSPMVDLSDVQQEIHSILNENLDQYIAALPPQKQQALLKEQAKTESQLEKMVNGLVDKAQKILQIILDWLKKIPGLNSFFQIQEAKTKTEKIIRLIETKKRL